MNMEPRKQAIIDALRKFMNQRSGIEFGNYGDVKAFRAEQRSITKDLREARELMRAVELSSITADDLLLAARRGYGGRLTIAEEWRRAGGKDHTVPCIAIDYVTGQYFPTEYRRAVCAVLASALWEYTREHCIPQPRGDGTYENTRCGRVSAISAGEWLRRHFQQQFGRGIASRWFS